MTREEILKRISEESQIDEREAALEELSEGDALDFSLALCLALALFKIFRLKENPYDVFAVEYLALITDKRI